MLLLFEMLKLRFYFFSVSCSGRVVVERTVLVYEFIFFRRILKNSWVKFIIFFKGFFGGSDLGRIICRDSLIEEE